MDFSIPKLCFIFSLVLTIHFINGSPSGRKEKRFVVSVAWPQGIVPYTFDSNFTQKGREIMRETTKKISSRTCIQFREKQDSDKHWLVLKNDKGCSSRTGRIVGETNGQAVTLGEGCISPSFFEHELGHALGFPHEQDRPDRDQYISWDKSIPDCPKTSQKGEIERRMDQAAVDIFYDYVSIMQDWKRCIRPKLPGPIRLEASDDNRGNTFSVLDYEKLNAIYDCDGCNGYRFRKISQLAYSHYPIVAGNDSGGQLVYVCRVYHEGSILVGKGKPDAEICYIAKDGKEHEYKENFEVLTDPKQSGRFKWVRRPDDFSIPENAVKGGRTVDRETIYIGRCKLNEFLFPGTLYRDARELIVAWNGGEFPCPDYEILVCQ